MQCPIDGSELRMTERSGVEIDYCPTCRGVWLDRGELDKIIERAAQAENSYAQRRADAAVRGERYDDDYDTYDDYTGKHKRSARDDYDRSDKPRRRKSFLEDVFDIFD